MYLIINIKLKYFIIVKFNYNKMENTNGKYISFSDKKKCEMPECIRDLLNLVIPVAIIIGVVFLGIWICSLI